MDKIKMSKKEFDELYEIDEKYAFGSEYVAEPPKPVTSSTDFDEEEEEHAAVDHTEGKEESFLTPEEELHDDKLEETIGWDPKEE